MRPLFYPRQRFSLWHLPLGLAVTLAPASCGAQMHHVDAPEHVTRALGVYEWTGDLDKPAAARFVPVSLYINGVMQDAGLYLARPVPFALQTGDLYSLERAGEPEGLLDLDYAQRVATNPDPGGQDAVAAWYGYGKFTPEAAPKAVRLHPSTRLPVIQSDGKAPALADEGRPHMARRGDATTPPATTTSDGETKDPSAKPDSGESSKTNGTGTGSAGSGSSTEGADDTDRPTLRHRDPSQDATRKREYGTKSKQASVTAVGPGPGDDPDRPVLGRTTDADSGTPPLTGLPLDMHQVVGVSDPAHRDQHNFAREWDTLTERTQSLSSLEALARPRAAAYLAANSLVPSSQPLMQGQISAAAVSNKSATEAPPATAGGKTPNNSTNTSADDTAAPPRLQRGVPSQYRPDKPSTPAASPASASPAAQPAPPPALPSKTATHSASRTQNHASVHRAVRTGTGSAPSLSLGGSSLTGYTLSYGGLPTFIYTAAASVTSVRNPAGLPSSASGVPPAPSTGITGHPVVYVTLVVQRLPSGELQVVLSSVTDSLHLDRSPRLRLIDAVDPDDSHRASLLFELRGASSRQFALYRLTAAQAEQTFTTTSIE